MNFYALCVMAVAVQITAFLHNNFINDYEQECKIILDKEKTKNKIKLLEKELANIYNTNDKRYVSLKLLAILEKLKIHHVKNYNLFIYVYSRNY